MSDQKRPYRMTAARRARGADAQADHRERGRAARGARPRAHLDQRRRRARGRAPLDRLPPLPGRGGAVRGLLVALARGEPAARPARLGRDRGPGGAHARPRSASSTRSTGAPRRCTTSLLRDEPLVPIVAAPARRLLRLPARDPGRPDGRPRPARARGAPDARGDRPRARVPDVALADARAGARPTTTPSRSCASLVEGAAGARRLARARSSGEGEALRPGPQRCWRCDGSSRQRAPANAPRPGARRPGLGTRMLAASCERFWLLRLRPKRLGPR